MTGDTAVVAVLGARSPVGEALLPRLVAAGHPVLALTRDDAVPGAVPGVVWCSEADPASFGTVAPSGPIPLVVSLAPLWALPPWLPAFVAREVRRVVALSSTSVRTKAASPDPSEQALVRRLARGEEAVTAWGRAEAVETVLLRPTMIWGGGRDGNVAELGRFARRFRFLPVLGAASGLRQPVHVDDVALACLAALTAPGAAGRLVEISGAEVLSYRAMAERIMAAAGLRPRVLGLPRVLVTLGGLLLRLHPRYRSWTSAMADRQNRDLVADHGEAARLLGFAPRPFAPGPGDVGVHPGA